MQHMNFDTELINHFARKNKKTSNDFINRGNIELAKLKADEFVDEMFRGKNCSRRNGVSLEPTEFTDALEILKLKRSLFLQKIQLSQTNCESLKLILDASSVDFEGLIDSRTPKFSESANNIEISNIDRYPSSSNSYSSSQHQDSIVVLRPAPQVMSSPKHVICKCSSLCSHQRTKGKARKVKNTYFSLKEIKKKLKCALMNNQEKKQLNSSIKCDKARPSSDTLETRSSFDHAKGRKLYEEEVCRARRGHETFPCNETSFGKLKLSGDRHSKIQEPDIYQEAKKHLSERFKLVKKNSDFENYRSPEKLGRILCSPKHDFSVPLNLKWNMKHLSVMTESGPPSWLSIKTHQKSDDIKDSDIEEHSSEQITKDLANMRFPSDTENSWNGDRLKDSTLLATTSSRLQETGSLSCTSPSSSSTYSPAKAGSIEYGEEYQSPVSVLEPIFIEDADTPKGSWKLQPRRITFEDCDYMNKDEAIDEYVRAVLQAAGFNCNNNLQNRPSQDEILNISFPYGDILLQIKTDIEPQLLVDFVNDKLLELYQHHFGYSPWTSSYLKPNATSLLEEQHFISHVAKEVKGAMFPEFLHPTLDQIVMTDVAKTSSWLDIRVDIEDLVSLIAEDILQDSIHGIAIMLSTWCT